MSKNSQPQSFESALTELESIVGQMETGQMALDQSLSAYKRGAELLRYCQSTLNDVEQQVRMLNDGALQPHQDV